MLRAAVSRYPDRPAVADGRARWSYADLHRHSLRLASLLHERGVRRGDRVVLVLPNGPEFVALFWAVLRLGAVVVPAAPEMTPRQLEHLGRDCSATLWVTASDAPGRAPAPATLGIDVVREALAAHADDDRVREPAPTGPGPGDTALLIYTSGSTAAPKGVLCPHERVVFAATAISARLGLRSTDVISCRLPFSFDYGLYQILLAALAGACLAVPRQRTEVETLRVLRDLGVTVVPVVPTLAALLARLATRDPRPTSVRRFTNTGAHLTAEHCRRLREAFPGADILSMYGMTECKRITVSEPDDDLRHPGTVGTALPGTEVTVVDDAGRPVRVGTTGEIVVRGPHVMAGYHAAPGPTAERFRAGADGETVLHTGDHGRMDSAGRLWLEGRRDDIFKRRGVRMSVAEIEAAALTVPGVEEAAAVPDVPGAGLVLWYTGEAAPELLPPALAERLDPARRPDRAYRLEELPRTRHGKTDRGRLATLPGGPAPCDDPPTAPYDGRPRPEAPHRGKR
ncbi:peptide synthetase [Streptomyces sp. WZ.A104]|nr:peptide synthetase [Streptomyces sp. WZ.A104]